MNDNKIKIAVIGASGYTGADVVRLAARHPDIEIAALTANAHAGQPLRAVFPHLAALELPALVANDAVDWRALDAVFCGLPHGSSQQVVAGLPDHLKIIDMSADFRLRDAGVYRHWYGGERLSPRHDRQAVYGLSELYRRDIAQARLVACPGCFPTAALLALAPLVEDGLISPDGLIIDAKTGVSGAGRKADRRLLFCETGEGVGAYAVAGHRHAPEIEQELALAAGRPVTVSFTPHLAPMSRGELLTIYATLAEGAAAQDCRTRLARRYAEEPFVHLAPDGVFPATSFVRGSNNVMIGVYGDRVDGRVILIAALDNLVKGSAGQAIQNFNLVYGLAETRGLTQVALMP